MAISSSSSSDRDEMKHVAVIPFPFGSHRITLPNLVFNLAHAAPNVVFSYIAPPQHNQEVFSKSNIPHNVKRFDISDGVPEGHVLGNNPIEKIDLFLKSCPQNLKQAVVDLAVKSTNLRVTCILSDAFMTPSLTLAQELKAPWIAVWVCLPTAISPHFYAHIVQQHCVKHGMESDKLVDFLPGVFQMRIADLPYESRIIDEDKETVISRALNSVGKALPQAKAVVVNFYEEIVPPLFVEDMRSKLQSMLFVGVLTLLPSPFSSPTTLMDPSGCLEWLEKQRSRSVVYICFGTVTVPPPPELVAIAEALEAGEFPYLWVIKDDLKGILPDGFVSGTSKRGKIVPWAPQMQVLAHESVGVYVAHSGMNSMMESAANGVPMICRHFFADQGMCGRTASDVWGFGVKLKEFTKTGLMKSLNLILMQEEGNKVRENALKMKKTLQDVAKPEGKAAHDFKTLVELISTS
ncbi:hypothetical protein K1719_018563 [Acacia pycnantha]|nr:hypothetical protein K1719_018563 [Acacia pycnantha]